jgi:ABC-2 type transport system permease protein
VMALAMTAYVALFGVLSLLIKRSLIVGIVFIALFEGVMANLPFAIRQISVMYYFRLLSLRWLDLDRKMLEAWDISLFDAPSALDCVLTLLLIAVFSTALACWIFTRNEFHVKTPESN